MKTPEILFVKDGVIQNVVSKNETSHKKNQIVISRHPMSDTTTCPYANVLGHLFAYYELHQTPVRPVFDRAACLPLFTEALKCVRAKNTKDVLSEENVMMLESLASLARINTVFDMLIEALDVEVTVPGNMNMNINVKVSK
jgi:hypothetical protein